MGHLDDLRARNMRAAVDAGLEFGRQPMPVPAGEDSVCAICGKTIPHSQAGICDCVNEPDDPSTAMPLKPIGTSVRKPLTTDEKDRAICIGYAVVRGDLATHDPRKCVVVSNDRNRIPRSDTAVPIKRTVEIEIDVLCAIDLDSDDTGEGRSMGAAHEQPSCVGWAIDPASVLEAVIKKLEQDDGGIVEAACLEYRDGGGEA